MKQTFQDKWACIESVMDKKSRPFNTKNNDSLDISLSFPLYFSKKSVWSIPDIVIMKSWVPQRWEKSLVNPECDLEN